MKELVDNLKNWVSLNSLDVYYVDERVFKIGDKSFYLIPDRKREKGNISSVFTDRFEINISPEDEKFCSKVGIDNLCFKFGNNFYYTPLHSIENPSLNILKSIGRAKLDLDIPYSFLGVRGKFEICNGVGHYSEWIERAKFLGITTLGICEHNTLAGTLPFQKECKREGIDYILGETITVQGADFSKYIVKCYVINEEGWFNLLYINKIINVDNEQSQYIDESDLSKYGEGLILVLDSECNLEHCLAIYTSFTKIYYQIDFTEYKGYEKESTRLTKQKEYLYSYRDRIPPVLIQDAFYVEKEYSHIKQILNDIGGVKFQYHSTDQWFKSLDEIFLQWSILFQDDNTLLNFFTECVENTVQISSICNYEIETSHRHLPVYEHNSSESNEDLFFRLIYEGMESKGLSHKQEYWDRVEKEIRVIKSGGVIDYFLILWDIIEWCKKENILTGVGRGSSAGCLVAYLLGITGIDPIEYGLLFERFLNEGRVQTSLPDIDTDFEGRRRDEVKRYMEDKYGINYVCSVGTYGTFKLKSAIRDIGQRLGLDSKSSNYITSSIGDDGRYSSGEFIDLFKEGLGFQDLLDFIRSRPDIVDSIRIILKQPKNASVHPCATLILPKKDQYGRDRDIYSWIPVKSVDGVLVSEWEGNYVEDAGFLKEDILGIKQLDKFREVFYKVEKNYGKKLSLHDVDLSSDKVFELFREGLSSDVFHFGSKGLTSYAQEVLPYSIQDMIAMISLYRPGPIESNTHKDYIDYKFGLKEPEYDFMLEGVTKETYGLYIYQEQVMMAVQQLGGMDLVTADNVRKAMGKMDMKLIKEYQEVFMKGAVNNGCDEIEAETIWNKLEAFARYGFNRCISGNEKIYRVGLNKSGKSTFNPTIKEMYNIRNDREYASKVGKIPLHERYKKEGYGKGFSLNTAGVLIKNKIIDIRYEGVKDTYKITLVNGRSITTTGNHRYPTSNGLKKLVDIDIHTDLLYYNTGYKVEDTSYVFTTKGTNNERYHSNKYQESYQLNSKKGVSGFTTKDTTQYKLFESYLENHKKHFCQKCNSIDKLEVHHIDGNHGNNIHSNLTTLCSSCHKKEHYKMGRVKMGEKGLETDLVKIHSIEYVGREDVYDVEMESPNHTFLTQNNIVTCNSHAACYTYTGIICQWLKVSYPLEFWTTSFEFAEDKEIPRYISEISKLDNGVDIVPPNVNKSSTEFISDTNNKKIYWAINKIKFVGDLATKCIINEREQNGDYFSLEDFYTRVDTSKVNKRVVENLILSGSFDEVYNIESNLKDRELILQEYYTLSKVKEGNQLQLSPLKKYNWYWVARQKEISGLGYFDYKGIILNSDLQSMITQYLDPIKLQSSTSLNKRVVVGGVIIDKKIRKTRKGDEFCSLLLESNDEFIHFLLWPDCWSVYKRAIESADLGMLLGSGTVHVDNFKKCNVLQSDKNTKIQIY